MNTDRLDALKQRLQQRHSELFKYCKGNPDPVFGGTLGAIKEIVAAIEYVQSKESQSTPAIAKPRIEDAA